MSDSKVQVGGGIGFFGLLGLLFIGLKLGGIINWSWWLVLLPLYGPLILFLLVTGLFFLAGIFCVVVAAFILGKMEK